MSKSSLERSLTFLSDFVVITGVVMRFHRWSYYGVAVVIWAGQEPKKLGNCRGIWVSRSTSAEISLAKLTISCWLPYSSIKKIMVSRYPKIPKQAIT
ncbi:13774_t:CDS:2 [Gigaspora rosea]|nr:13774_t:CDS:2 [Gigaspora rosea]